MAQFSCAAQAHTQRLSRWFSLPAAGTAHQVGESHAFYGHSVAEEIHNKEAPKARQISGKDHIPPWLRNFF